MNGIEIKKKSVKMCFMVSLGFDYISNIQWYFMPGKFILLSRYLKHPSRKICSPNEFVEMFQIEMIY